MCLCASEDPTCNAPLYLYLKAYNGDADRHVPANHDQHGGADSALGSPPEIEGMPGTDPHANLNADESEHEEHAGGAPAEKEATTKVIK